MKTINLKGVLALVSVLLTSIVLLSFCDSKPGLSYDYKDIENRSVSFVKNQMADGGLGAQKEDLKLASDADALKKVLNIQEPLRRIISETAITSEFFMVFDFTIVENDSNLEIIIHTAEQITANGDINIEERGNYYRLILVQENMEWKVQKAISSTPSCMLLFPERVVGSPDQILSFDFEDFDTVVAECEKRVEEEYGIVVE